jgi:hypothetical protein
LGLVLLLPVRTAVTSNRGDHLALLFRDPPDFAQLLQRLSLRETLEAFIFDNPARQKSA